MSKRYSLGAGLAFFAFTALFGIAAHLLSELFGLGSQADAALVVSARHGYLVASAALAVASLLAAVLVLPRGERRERIASLVRALPFGGSGLGFATTAFLAQFAFGAVTQIGEGCPLAGGDLVSGIIAGVIAAALGALAVTLGKRRVLEFALGLVWAIIPVAAGAPAPSGIAAERGPSVPAPRRTPFSFRYRPPPIAA